MLEDGEDDEPAAPGDIVATQAEKEAAVRAALSDKQQKRRLLVAAEYILTVHSRLRLEWSAEDLLQEALVAVLQARRAWKKNRVDFKGFVGGTMKSLASSRTKSMVRAGVEVISESALSGEDEGPGGGLELLASPAATPMEELMRKEHEAQGETAAALIRAKFSPDALSGKILDGLLAGKSKAEIRAELHVEKREFWTADQRLTRAIEQHLKATGKAAP